MSMKHGTTSRRRTLIKLTERESLRPNCCVWLWDSWVKTGNIRPWQGSKGDLKPGHVHKVRGRGLITSSDRA